MKISKILLSSMVLPLVLSGCIRILDVDTLNKKAATYMSKGDYDSAIARLVSINDLDPNYHQVHYNLGIAYREKGELEKSLAELERAAELKPDLMEVYYSLGVVNKDLADKIIEDIDSTVEPLKKQEKTKALGHYVKAMFANYEHYLTLAPEGRDKERIESRLDYLETKYKKYLLTEEQKHQEHSDKKEHAKPHGHH